MSAALIEVPVEAIRLSRNVRSRLFEREQKELAASIARHGVLVPLLGHGEAHSPVLDDGHRRLDGAKRAGLATVPMLLAGCAPSPVERLSLQLLANAYRKDLRVIERARAYQRLMRENGWTAAELSDTLGSPSPGMVSKMLTLLTLPESALDRIEKGLVPMSSAYAIATIADADVRDRLLEEVASGQLKREELLKRIEAHRWGRSPAAKPRRPRQRKERLVFTLGEGCSVTVSALSLTAESVALGLAELSERIRAESQSGRSLAEIAQSLKAR